MLLFIGAAYFVLLFPKAVAEHYQPGFFEHVWLDVGRQSVITEDSTGSGVKCKRLEWTKCKELGRGGQGEVVRRCIDFFFLFVLDTHR